MSDGKRLQHCASRELQDQAAYKADEHGITVKTVEPSDTSQQCPKCGCMVDETRDGQQLVCLDCSYPVNSHCNAAKNTARILGVHLRRGQTSLDRGAFCQHALKSATMTVNATDLASGTFVSADRESTDKPTAEAVGG